MTPGLTIKEGPHLRLRQLREDDLPRLAEISGGEEGAKHWWGESLSLPDGAGKEFKQYVVETLAGEWVGWTGFGAERDAGAGGYFFIAEPFRGQGYGTELVRLALEVMLDDCGAARCEIDYHDWNTVAERVYLKLGFRETMRIRIPEDRLSAEDRQFAPGREVHAVVVAITREEWRARKQG
jgi:RimJ/RimL family protein N-acetyltransferase